ncbi:conjugal transfer protein TraD [[Haemophilus] felis]|uniref:Conjugal transfer protein TraD n=1 Tax=[Haemophilus] felis TaxID=123822 RepID=A0A1T0AX62_9PAST|nr:conjugal transfer protein TraD [[Haemophilus] felis]OOS02485.1 conjugal transfer protein TraD [[Haemophilus] felis]
MSDNNEDDSFPSFNGMNRPAMVYGVPMVLGIFTALFIVLSLFGGFYLKLGYYAWILPSLGLMFLLFIKIISEDDPNALAFIRWRIRAYLIMLSQGNPIIHLSSNAVSRKVYNANRQFKKL